MIFGEEFISSGRVFVDMLRSAVYLVSDKITDCTSVSYGLVGRW